MQWSVSRASFKNKIGSGQSQAICERHSESSPLNEVVRKTEHLEIALDLMTGQKGAA
jgi:hypothetical protein